jgi:hypothetical protein
MSEHVSVRFKGSRWASTAHRAVVRGTGGMGQRPDSAGNRHRTPAATASEEDLLLNLAVRHFADLQLTSREAESFAKALLHTAATGQTVSVKAETSSAHTYEIRRRIAAVTIRFGDDQMNLPIHAAQQLAEVLQKLHGNRETTDIAA